MQPGLLGQMSFLSDFTSAFKSCFTFEFCFGHTQVGVFGQVFLLFLTLLPAKTIPALNITTANPNAILFIIIQNL